MFFHSKQRVSVGWNGAINLKKPSQLSDRTVSTESGFLYADAMGVALVASLLLPVLLLLMSTLVLQWKDAERTRDVLQTAIMVMEENKYNIKHHKSIVAYSDTLVPGCYVTSSTQRIDTKGGSMPQLVVTAYDSTNGDKELMQFETYVWLNENE